ncbi:phage tail family protein [Kurthia sp. Dielmo]|uniref:phage tail family protein n=1 Tax=Kurthia sp. Dielmo TaxID=1033738 RepID=UPI0002E83557|nr:phage tail family protein [Kurthia sp. Dielmo]
MIIKGLTITNANGESLTFGDTFKLYEEIDLSGLSANVSTSEKSGDGASYQNTTLETRDFEIPFFIHRLISDKEWYEEKRRDVYRVCNPKKNPMRIDFTTKSNAEYYVNAELVSSPSMPTDFEHSNNVWQKVLLQFDATDPYIYARNKTNVDLATWIPLFEFALEIPEGEGIEMGQRSPSLIANVVNDGQDDTGMLIKFKATAALKNPSLINVNTYEEFKINIDMLPGDVIEVSTYRGNKYAKLTRNNITTSVFGKIDYLSTFLQLRTGDNLFRYDAAQGLDNMEISMQFNEKFLGV